MIADTPTGTTPAAAPAAPAAPAPAAAPAAVPASTKVAPPSGLQLGDTAKILAADDSEFGKMFGIDAILAGKPFEFSPSSAALEGAASEEEGAGGTATAVDEEPTVPVGADGNPLPAYREDAQGRLHAEDGKFVSKDGAKPGEEVVEEGAPDPAVDPATPPAEPVKLATEFALFDDAGQEVEYPTNLKIKMTANGKEIELPLDRTVRLAKMGFYNEEKEQRFDGIEARNKQLEPFAREVYEESQTLQGHLDRILAGDDEFLARAREHYKKETSPEAEVTRLRARVKQLETAPARTGSDPASTPQAQAATTAAPVVQELIESNKDVVPEAEIWAALGKLIAPYRDRAGAIPPDRLRDVVAHVNGALRYTVESLAETRRLAAKSTAQSALDAKVAKGKVLELKRKVTTAGKPTGQRPAATPSPTPATPAKANPSAEDTIETALQAGLGRMRAGG